MIRFNETGFTRDTLIIEYINKILKNYQPGMQKILIMDTAGSHTTDDVKDALSDANIDHLYIPGGCTHLLQPLDVTVNKVLKEKIREQYLTWLQKSVDQKKEDKPSINPPELQNIMDWSLEALTHINADLCEKAFKTTGITSDFDLLKDVNTLHSKLKDIVGEFFDSSKEEMQETCDDNEEEVNSNASDDTEDEDYLDRGEQFLKEIANECEIFFENEI